MTYHLTEEQHLGLFRVERALILVSQLACNVQVDDAADMEDWSCFLALMSEEISRAISAEQGSTSDTKNTDGDTEQ